MLGLLVKGAVMIAGMWVVSELIAKKTNNKETEDIYDATNGIDSETLREKHRFKMEYEERKFEHEREKQRDRDRELLLGFLGLVAVFSTLIGLFYLLFLMSEVESISGPILSLAIAAISIAVMLMPIFWVFSPMGESESERLAKRYDDLDDLDDADEEPATEKKHGFVNFLLYAILKLLLYVILFIATGGFRLVWTAIRAILRLAGWIITAPIGLLDTHKKFIAFAAVVCVVTVVCIVFVVLNNRAAPEPALTQVVVAPPVVAAPVATQAVQPQRPTMPLFDLSETRGRVGFRAPSSWRRVVSADGENWFYYPFDRNEDGYLVSRMITFDTAVPMIDISALNTTLGYVLEGMSGSTNVIDFRQLARTEINRIPVQWFESTVNLSGSTFLLNGFIFVYGDSIYTFGAFFPETGDLQFFTSAISQMFEGIAIREYTQAELSRH